MNHSWNDFAEMLLMSVRMRQGEWECGFPPFDSLPDEALELAVDEWCFELAADLMGDLKPPTEVAQWILARMLSMSVSARELAKMRSAPPPRVDADTVAQFLIGEWHGALRERWGMMVTLTLPDVS